MFAASPMAHHSLREQPQPFITAITPVPTDTSRDTRGKLVILAGPSGVGKTSIVRELLKLPDTRLSVSATTRPPRSGERDGVDYHFVSMEEFRKRVHENGFAEHAEVHSNCYGTPRGPLEEALRDGAVIFLDIDVQGAEQIKVNYPEAVGIFILPPSLGELEKRLRKRGTDADEVIERRLQRAREEIERKDEFDHRVVNRDLDAAYAEVIRIINEPRA